MKKQKVIEVVINGNPSKDGKKDLPLTNACVESAAGLEEFLSAVREDLRDVSSRIPSGIDARVFVDTADDGGWTRIRVHALYSGVGDLKFWDGIRMERCNRLSSEWFTRKWTSRNAG